MNAIFERVSIRHYKNRPVESEKINDLLKAAMASPSAGNQQPWRFYVIENRGILESLGTISKSKSWVKKAAAAIVVCYIEDVPKPRFAQIDASVATEHILLESAELGLGAVWLGIAPIEENMEKVANILKLPNGVKAFSIVSLGYPDEEKQQEDRYDLKKVTYIL